MSELNRCQNCGAEIPNGDICDTCYRTQTIIREERDRKWHEFLEEEKKEGEDEKTEAR